MSEIVGKTGETTANPEVVAVRDKLQAAHGLEMETSRRSGDIRTDDLELIVAFGATRIGYRVAGSHEKRNAVWRRARIDEQGNITSAQEQTGSTSTELNPEEAEAFVLAFGPMIAEAVGNDARSRAVAAITRYDAVMGTPVPETAIEETAN